MQNLSDDQLKRQDFVDNEIYDLMKRLTPSKREIEWDIEMIGDIRDTMIPSNIGLSIDLKSLVIWNFIPDEN